MVYQKISKSASSNAQSPDKSVSIVPQSVPVSLTPIAHFHDFTQVPVYSPTIQAKLTIGSPNDRYEQEADRVAAQVVQQLQRPASIQRQDELDETIQAKSMLQRPDAIVTSEADPEVVTAIDRQRGGGQALDTGLQQSMGRTMGADFSQVRVHTDSQSDQLNKSIQAKAFTTGQDVFFRQGAYEPSSRNGQELIAHELTHVVQQNVGVVQGKIQCRKQDSKRMRPGANPKIDKSDPQAIQQLLQEAAREEEEGQLKTTNGKGKKGTLIRRSMKKKPPVNQNYRGGLTGLPSRIGYGVKATVKSLPDVAVHRMSPAGPNGTSGIDPDDYGFCETEAIRDADIKVTAVLEGNEWHVEVTKISARYSKIIQLPPGVHEVTGPGGGGAGETTLGNSKDQITCLLATFGPPYYMASAIDGHESVHEKRLLPAIRAVAPEIQRQFVRLTVDKQTYDDKASALNAIKLLPAYATTVSGLRDLWDAEYVNLIGNDHQGAAQKGEEKATRPMIDRINSFRIKKGLKKIPVKYTWDAY